jgi:hypothetical protein
MGFPNLCIGIKATMETEYKRLVQGFAQFESCERNLSIVDRLDDIAVGDDIG